jgi:hypothetical protein
MKKLAYLVLSAIATYAVAAAIYCSITHQKPATRVGA